MTEAGWSPQEIAEMRGLQGMQYNFELAPGGSYQFRGYFTPAEMESFRSLSTYEQIPLMDKIINFYKTFNKYKNNNYDDIYYHILPSINSNQYKIFEDQQGLYGFVNWAFINKEEEDNYKLKGKIGRAHV